MTNFQRFLSDYFKRDTALSQRALAKKAGISHVFLNRIVKGHANPSMQIAERIADATGSTLGKSLSKMEKMQTV